MPQQFPWNTNAHKHNTWNCMEALLLFKVENLGRGVQGQVAYRLFNSNMPMMWPYTSKEKTATIRKLRWLELKGET